jgi:hypothetical protein
MSPGVFGLPPDKALQATVNDGASLAATDTWALAFGGMRGRQRRTMKSSRPVKRSNRWDPW